MTEAEKERIREFAIEEATKIVEDQWRPNSWWFAAPEVRDAWLREKIARAIIDGSERIESEKQIGRAIGG